MKIKKRSKLRNIISRKILSLYYRIENIGNGGSIENSGEITFIKSIQPDKYSEFIVFDIGANLGEYTNIIDLYTLLESKGFKICRMMKKNLEYRTYDPIMENFVCQNFVAVSSEIFNKYI